MLLLFISIVTGILALMIIPIFVGNQKSRENILRLFSTISTDKILLMMTTVNLHKDRIITHGDSTRYSKNTSNSKKITFGSNNLDPTSAFRE